MCALIMEYESKISERVIRLEEKTEAISIRTSLHEEKIERLGSDLVTGLKTQEDLLRELIGDLKDQQATMRQAYDRMSSFSRGVLWLGGLGTAVAVFFLRFSDKIFGG